MAKEKERNRKIHQKWTAGLSVGTYKHISSLPFPFAHTNFHGVSSTHNANE